MTRIKFGTCFVVITVCLAVVLSLFSQKNDVVKNSRLSEDEAKILETVRSFWEFSEAGEFEKAHTLTTDQHRQFSVSVRHSEPAERWLNKAGIRHKKISINRKQNDEAYVVAVKVVKRKREYYLFHDVVKTDSGDWRILSTSY